VALGALVLIIACSGAAFGRSASRQALSLGLALVAFAPPLLCGGHPFGIAFLAVFAVLPLSKWMDHHKDRRDCSLGRRVWSFLSPFDVRETRAVAPGLDPRLAASVLIHALVCGAGLGMAWSAPRLGVPAWAVTLLRWLGAVLTIYGGVGSTADLLRFLHGLVGIHVPPIQLHPVLARSVQEFWSARWNRPVSALFRRHWFAPFARRRHPKIGLLFAFSGSALLHFWLVVVSVGLGPALVMGLFFVVQGALIVLELRLDVRRWPPAAARAWTLPALLLPCPLFVDPFLRVLTL